MNKKVLLFLSNGFEEYEVSVFTDVIGWSRECDQEPVDLVTTALRPKLKGTWNLIVEPELSFAEVIVDEFDALAIPGGFEEAGFYEDAYDERFLELIRSFGRQNKPIASICVGALPVAKSGILKGCKGTTYDLPGSIRQKQLVEMGVNLQHERIVVDDNIITSTGPATALDVAFTLLEMLTSKANVAEVKRQMRFTD